MVKTTTLTKGFILNDKDYKLAQNLAVQIIS